MSAPQFVILRHETHDDSARPSHFDLMLETGDVLRAWAIDALPGEAPQTAEQLPDHREIYLNYEGPISGNRGFVTRVDKGEYQSLEESPDRLVARLAGQKHSGVLTLVRTAAEDHFWIVSFSAEPTSGSSSAVSSL